MKKLNITDMEELDSEQIQTCAILKEIGIRKDYYKYINQSKLEQITMLPLRINHKNELESEIQNQRDNMSFFQESTNEIIRFIVYRINTNDILHTDIFIQDQGLGLNLLM